MKRLILSSALAVALLAAGPATAAETPPFAVLDACTGDVQLGASGTGTWAPAQPKAAAAESQAIKTGAKSQATVRFSEGDLTAVVGENTQIGLQDLLLKTRLEKMRGKITQPAADAQQTQMSVTPLTGVRGTDEAEGKAEDPNRQHHWEENAPAR